MVLNEALVTGGPVQLFSVTDRSELPLVLAADGREKPPAWTSVVLLDDTPGVHAREEAHKRRWRAWLYWSNVLQFLDTGGGDAVQLTTGRLDGFPVETLAVTGGGGVLESVRLTLAGGTPDDLRRELERVVAPERVLTRPAELVMFASDASVYRMLPRAVVLADGVEEVRAICEAVSKPVNVLARRGQSFDEVVEAGAQRVSVGGQLTWVATAALTAAAERLRDGDFSVLSARPPEGLGG